MKNEEKYVEEIMDIVPFSRLAVSKETNKPCRCNQIMCKNCLFGQCISHCDEKAKEWLNAEYEPYVDWSKVEVDTKVLVSDDKILWHKGHFARYKNGLVWTWNSGKTSWSRQNEFDFRHWNYAKLYEGEENDKD